MAATCECINLQADLLSDCIECSPGIQDEVYLYEKCGVESIPAADVGTKTITSDIVLPVGESWWQFSRIDRQKSSLSGAKSQGSNRHTWTVEFFVPCLDDASLVFINTITSTGYEAAMLVTDAQGNTLLYEAATFEYTYSSDVATNDAGDPGWTLTATYTGRIPCLYEGVIV